MAGESCPSVTALTCAVLVGGAGRRFGGDKLAAQLDGRRVIDHTLAAVAGLADRLLLVGDGAEAFVAPGRVPVADARPGQRSTTGPVGPLAGVVAALEAATTPLVAVVAADMPLANAALLRRLAVHWAGEPAVVPAMGARPQPLHAVYATAHRAAFRAAFDAGARSPLTVARRIGARFVDADGDGGWAVDVDTPADLRVLEQRLRRR